MVTETEKEALTETRKTPPSDFAWYEYHTSDVAAAETFYKGVLGWGTQDAGMPDRRYTLVTVGKTAIGGLLEKPAHTFANGAKPGWIGYIGVSNVDESSRRVQEAGGVVHRAAEDIPGIGRFAVVADPQRAVFVLFQPADGVQEPERLAAGTTGTVAWHDLAAIDWEADFAFYADLFGWTKAQAIEMGPNGVYQIFAAGAEPIGGMMTRMNPSQPPGWFFYFHIEEMAAAIARVHEYGGKLVHGPSVVPGGQQIAHCVDTQGGMFGIVTPKS